VTRERRENFFHEAFGGVCFSRGSAGFQTPSTLIHGLPNAFLAHEGELTPAWAELHGRRGLGLMPLESSACQTKPKGV
jgi:hypothetical protein